AHERDRALGRPLRVLDPNDPGRRSDRAGVGDLAAGLGVERRAIEEEQDAVPLGGDLALAPALVDRALDPRVGREVFVADELRRRDPGRVRPAPTPLERASRTLSLRGHDLVEAAPVDLEARLARHLLGELARKPIRVVELERRLAGEAPPRLRLRAPEVTESLLDRPG